MNDTHRRFSAFLVACLLILGVRTSAEAGEPLVTAKIEPSRMRIVVDVDGKRFTCYKYGSLQKYPYFWPVNGPTSGKSITTESSWPWPHHRSLFFGCDQVNGGNYWQDSNERGQILSQGPKIVVASGPAVVFEDECLWRQPGQEPTIRDRRKVTVSAPSSHLRVIDFEVTLDPLTDIRIGKTNHSFFSARVVPELSVDDGGTLVNAQGDLSEKGTFGVASPWCDYSGRREGVIEGLAIFQNPQNRWYPSKWFTRDYGFFSPTPMYWPEGQYTELPKGQPLTLRYRAVAHDGDAKEAGIAKLFEEYQAGTGSSAAAQ
jgi:hypothetical protein